MKKTLVFFIFLALTPLALFCASKPSTKERLQAKLKAGNPRFTNERIEAEKAHQNVNKVFEIIETEKNPTRALDKLKPLLRQHKTLFNDLNDGRRYHDQEGCFCMPPLIKAIYYKRNEIVCWLIENGIDVNTVGTGGISPLFMAITQQNAELVALLLKNNATIHTVTFIPEKNEIHTPLMTAFDSGTVANSAEVKLDIALQLIKAGADINRKNNAGNTLLHKAVAAHDLSTVALLLKAGADITTTNERGETSLSTCLRKINDCDRILQIESTHPYYTKRAQSLHAISALIQQKTDQKPEPLAMMMPLDIQPTPCNQEETQAQNQKQTQEQKESAKDRSPEKNIHDQKETKNTEKAYKKMLQNSARRERKAARELAEKQKEQELEKAPVQTVNQEPVSTPVDRNQALCMADINTIVDEQARILVKHDQFYNRSLLQNILKPEYKDSLSAHKRIEDLFSVDPIHPTYIPEGEYTLPEFILAMDPNTK
jgi:hypothetical protein